MTDITGRSDFGGFEARLDAMRNAIEVLRSTDPIHHTPAILQETVRKRVREEKDPMDALRDSYREEWRVTVIGLLGYAHDELDRILLKSQHIEELKMARGWAGSALVRLPHDNGIEESLCRALIHVNNVRMSTSLEKRPPLERILRALSVAHDLLKQFEADSQFG